MLKCNRCHEQINNSVFNIYYIRKDKTIHLCTDCYRFINQRFDDVIEEYILRKE